MAKATTITPRESNLCDSTLLNPRLFSFQAMSVFFARYFRVFSRATFVGFPCVPCEREVKRIVRFPDMIVGCYRPPLYLSVDVVTRLVHREKLSTERYCCLGRIRVRTDVAKSPYNEHLAFDRNDGGGGVLIPCWGEGVANELP